jgi:hypothetical protein
VKLHFPVTLLLGKGLLVPIELEAGKVPERLRTSWEKENSPPFLEN